MGQGRPTKVLGKRSVPVELDYSITPGDWDKPLNGVLFGLWPHTTYNNKQTRAHCSIVTVLLSREQLWHWTTKLLSVAIPYAEQAILKSPRLEL
jgi:hypothetical protein